MTEQQWQLLRDTFAVTREYAYFQSAGMSPIPQPTLQAITQAYERIHLHGDRFWMEDFNRGNQLRVRLASIINTQPENITFAQNTSTAFSFVASALKEHTSKPFNLVSLWDEFPSTHIPFEMQGISVRFVMPDNGVYTVEKILEATDENTLGVACSYVQYATGFRMDIHALGQALKQRGLLFLVNATQAFPMFEVDIESMNIDVMTASFHKWGCSAHAGSLFFTSPAFRKNYPNPIGGWLSVSPPAGDFIPTQKNEGYKQFRDATQYNLGTMNYHVLGGLDTSYGMMQQAGLQNIRNRILDLTGYLIEQLANLPVKILSPVHHTQHRSGIVLISLNNSDNAQAVDFLEKQKIITTIRAGNIRVSVNFFNNHDDVDRLTKALGHWLHP